MKILIFSQYFWPENFRINDVANFLSKKKDDIIVLTAYPSYPNKQHFKKFKYKKKHKSLKIYRVPAFKRSESKISILLNYISFTFLSFFYLLFFFLSKKLDVMLIFGTSPPSTLIAGVLFKFFKKIKIIYWILDLWPDTLKDLGYIKSNLVFNIFNKFLIFFYNKCELILCQSKKITNIIRNRCGAKVKYFPSWSETEYSRNKVNNKKKMKNFNIFFSGNIGEAQDVNSIIKTINILKNENIKWNFIGSGSQLNRMKTDIAKTKLINKVKFFGKVKSKKAAKLLNRADALLITLLDRKVFSYTVPGKLQNYLALGKPILGMINGEANKIINNNLGLACKSSDYLNLAKNVLKIKKMSIKQRNTISKNCIKYASVNFSRNILLHKLRNEYIQKI